MGSILLDNGALNFALELLGKDDFYSEAHRLTFEKMAEISEKNRTIDLVTLSEELAKDGLLEKAGGAAYLAALTDGVPIGTMAAMGEYCRIVKEKSTIRRLINASNNVHRALPRRHGRPRDADRPGAKPDFRHCRAAGAVGIRHHPRDR